MGETMHGQSDNWTKVQRIPQKLRNTATDAERLLWKHLRGQQLGVKFRRQHPFNNYVLDFVCLEKKLVVELDGGQHSEAVAKDEARTRELSDAGFRVIRFWNNQVFQETEAVIETIMLALAETHPLPGPPLEGEGVYKALP
ncbi:MAG: endonuclease domain-containing protein [Rhodocyclaceae bacterium]|nr:endonuclease domain-containing protein [Rhodocyclaceae bacterium]